MTDQERLTRLESDVKAIKDALATKNILPNNIPPSPGGTIFVPGSSVSRAYGYRPDLPDQRDFLFSSLSLKTAAVPASVDLRKTCSPIEDQGQLGCHEEHTEFLTKSGWKLGKNLSKNDMLATINPETKELFFENPTKIFKKKYKGNLICAKNKSLDFSLTPNHNMLIRKWNEAKRTLEEKYIFVKAENLGWYAGLMNNVVWSGSEKASKEFLLLGVSHKQKPQRQDKIIPMKYWLQLLGIYLAEGTMIKNENNYKIQLAASKDREKEFIKNLLGNLGLNYCELKDRITFENKQIYCEYEKMGLKGVRAPFKFVPKFVFEQSSENIREFLLGHFMGDGCEDANRAHYTSSIKLAEDLQLLIFLSGNESRIGVRDPRTSTMKNGRVVKGNFPEYRVSVCEKKNLSIENKEVIFEEYYEGYVYCAEVPSYHTLVTRRNGKILISGNSCTANALVGALEFLEDKDKIPMARMSRLFVYYNERVLERSVASDSGAALRDGIKALASQGCCPETEWPYSISKFSTKPPAPCYTDGLKHIIQSYYRIQTLTDMKACLASGFPFVFGFTVYSSFESAAVARTGIVPMPAKNEKVLGGHAVLAVGYNDVQQRFIVRNSWGTGWGMLGYFTLPYAYLTNPSLASDMWYISRAKGL